MRTYYILRVITKYTALYAAHSQIALVGSPNYALKWDNAPAAYGAFFDGSEVRLRFYLLWGRYPLAW